MSSRNLVAFIFARGGSKGIVGKNVKYFCGVPLIERAVRQAKGVAGVERVIVSTDSEEIAELALKSGAEIPVLRPDHLSDDKSSEWDAWKHALEFMQERGELPKTMLSLPTTAPLRLCSDIETCIEVFEKTDSDIVVTITDCSHNPYFNMVEQAVDDSVCLFSSLPEGRVFRRQDSPRVYGLTTVAYVVDTRFVLDHDSWTEGLVKGVYIPPERAVDIDTNLDFEIAEFLFSKRGDCSS